MNTGRIRGVAIGNESNLLIRLGSAYSLIHGSDGGLGISVVSDVVSSDLEVFR